MKDCEKHRNLRIKLPYSKRLNVFMLKINKEIILIPLVYFICKAFYTPYHKKFQQCKLH